MKTKADAPAYPNLVDEVLPSDAGLSKRERFAAGAHDALLSNPSIATALGMAGEDLTIEQAAKVYADAAVKHANALIEALNEEGE